MEVAMPIYARQNDRKILRGFAGERNTRLQHAIDNEDVS
jgi:hypothetical protein